MAPVISGSGGLEMSLMASLISDAAFFRPPISSVFAASATRNLKRLVAEKDDSFIRRKLPPNSRFYKKTVDFLRVQFGRVVSTDAFNKRQKRFCNLINLEPLALANVVLNLVANIRNLAPIR